MTASLRHHRLISAAFVLAALSVGSIPTASAALAEEPVETAIKGWISGLDASPNLVAGYSDLSYDQATRVATIKNLSIRSETLATKAELTFDTITVAGFGQAADGAVQSSAVKAGNAELSFGGFIDMHFSDIDVANLAVPSFAAFKLDQNRLVTSYVKAIANGMQSSLDHLTIGNITLTQTVQDQKTVASYGGYSIVNMRGGKVEKITAGPFSQETPSPNGLLNMRIEKIEALGYDMNALVDVLDPDRYPGGAGDGKWRTVLALETIHNMSTNVPGATFRAGLAEVENFKVRQPPSNPIGLLDRLVAGAKVSEEETPALMRQYLPGLLRLFGIDRLRFADLDVTAPDIERFHIGDFHIDNFSSDGLGEIGVSDIDVAAVDKGTFGAERLAVGGIGFPSVDAIVAAANAGGNVSESDSLALLPTIGYAEGINLDVTQGGKKLGALDRGRLDLSAYIGPVPTKAAIDIRGLDLDLSQVDDRKARDLFEGLGYDRLHADYGLQLAWREVDQSVNVTDFRLAIRDLGNLNARFTLTGLSRSTIEHPREIENALQTLMFNSATIAVTDKSVVDRAIGMQAKKLNVAPETFRQQISGALPLFMMVLKNPGFQAKLAPALQAFISAPGTFTINANPPAPVPLPNVIVTADSHPEQLPDLLNVQVEASKADAAK